jgi:hypothetical protein
MAVFWIVTLASSAYLLLTVGNANIVFSFFLAIVSLFSFLKIASIIYRDFADPGIEKSYKSALEDAIKSPRDGSKYTKALQLGRQFYRNAGKSDAAVELAVQNDLKSIAK